MLSDILTSLLIVGGVDADRKAPGKETSIKGDHPLWSIESNDIDRCELIVFEGDKRFGKFYAFVVVLSVI